MRDFDVALGAHVKVIRAAAGLTQAEIGRQVRAAGHRWHQTTVDRVESGARPVRASEVSALASALNVSLDRLLALGDVAAPRAWPRTATLSPAVEVVADYRGHRWIQISLDRWESEDRTVIAPFRFLAETWGPLQEVRS